MPKKNIAPGTNHIKVPLPQGEPKPFVLLPVRSEDYDMIEKIAKAFPKGGLEDVVSLLLDMWVIHNDD